VTNPLFSIVPQGTVALILFGREGYVWKLRASSIFGTVNDQHFLVLFEWT
jgi:hypothetical protein